MLMSALLIVLAVGTALYLGLSPRLEKSMTWRAVLTPLASIMGSGFLISAPLLAGVVGNAAVLYMAALLALAYLVGGAIRFNIRHFEPVEFTGHGPAQEIAFASRIVLSGAYFISVSYYLQLLAAFVLDAVGHQNQMAAHWISTALLLVIGGIGVWRGLDETEQVERFAVSLNLGVIGALLVALLVYNVRLFHAGAWQLNDLGTQIDLHDLRVVLGLLIVVQGFETSRYLGDEHPAELRVRTMRIAQLVSSAIYLTFIGLATVLFRSDLGSDVTAIIAMTKPVAVVLPILLAVAAIGSQFSAAMADNAGAGGLIEDLSERKLSARIAYLLVLVVTLAITWGTNVNQIISYASRAFALYYALQGSVAFLVARHQPSGRLKFVRSLQFLFVTGACGAVFWLGVPSG